LGHLTFYGVRPAASTAVIQLVSSNGLSPSKPPRQPKTTAVYNDVSGKIRIESKPRPAYWFGMD